MKTIKEKIGKILITTWRQEIGVIRATHLLLPLLEAEKEKAVGEAHRKGMREVLDAWDDSNKHLLKLLKETDTPKDHKGGR